MRISMQRIRQELNGNATTTIVVAKAYCAPSRPMITSMLAPYHVWFDAPSTDAHTMQKDDNGFPSFQTCEVVVKKKQAEWAEYLLLSAKTPAGGGVFAIMGKMQNEKNRAYAERRSGLPTPWALKSGKMKASWVEHDCHGLEPVATSKGNKQASLKGSGGIMYTSERRNQRSAKKGGHRR